VQLLSGNDFFSRDAVFDATPAFTTSFSFEAYITEKRTAERALRSTLARQWKNHVDFEVGDDENIAFTPVRRHLHQPHDLPRLSGMLAQRATGDGFAGQMDVRYVHRTRGAYRWNAALWLPTSP
jgi:hypothetical protein